MTNKKSFRSSSPFGYFLAAFFILALLSVKFTFAQISPGPLAKAHSHLEGISNCTKCHVLGDKVSNAKCLDCHTEIKVRIDQNKGYHASAQVKGKQCASCHNDHHGLNFQIIRFDKDKFNHDLAGYKLSGAHSKKKCADCHKTEYISDKKLKLKKTTYLGLQTNCLNCHDDYHQNTLATTCADCHSDDKFKPAPKFDHQKTSFRLTGKHENVACIGCHKTYQKNGVKFQEFKGVKASNCSSCHKDPHNNKFGPNCTDCHSNESFAAANGGKNFDHNKTDYRLDGKHQTVACKSCHKQKLTTPLNFKNCFNCHQDYHEKQFEKNGVSPDCSACHSVNGFSDFVYSIEQHNENGFPLIGSHIATPCTSCHLKQEKWKFKEIGKKCSDCHQNIHSGYISEKYYPGQNCESCHNSDRWRNVSFDHNQTQFELTGAHKDKTCRDCHFNGEKSGHSNQKFSGIATACVNCHKDVHMQQFEVNGNTDCARCHTQDAFKPAGKFDHNTAQFKLDGKHVNVACEKCHTTTGSQGQTYVLYKINKFKCEDCHL